MVENVVTVLTFVQFVQNVTNLTQLLLFCGKVFNDLVFCPSPLIEVA